MNGEVFQEKMDKTHRASLCRMVRAEVLPDCLLVEYKKVKRMVDIIDGSLTVGVLAIIALRAGYDPDTGKFQKFLNLGETTEGEDARLQAQADKKAVKPSVADDKVIEEAVEQPVEQESPILSETPVNDNMQANAPVEQPAVSGATGQAVDKPEVPADAMLWSPGMPVNVLHDEELKQGKIVGISRPSEVGKQVGAVVKLTVEFEGGETETFNENEVEAD